MSEDVYFEIKQARAEYAKLDEGTGINVELAGRYLKAAVASRNGGGRVEWDSLFSFWRTIIQGGWACPECGGEMETGEYSGVRCKTWNCSWSPGRPIAGQ
jgi:hypothetical protein